MVNVILEDLTKKFGKITAVDDINLEIKEGEFFTLVGPSGCGKTTTCRLIAGLEFPTAGKIYFNGEVVNEWPPKVRNVAMVFQNYALYPNMTVYKNIEFPLKLGGVSEVEREKRGKSVAEMLGIKQLLNRKPQQLSGGQQQRVALARALIREPKVFLLDEPLSNLDAKLRVHARSEIKRIQRNLKTTTIYVTHDQVEALTMSDRMAVMNFGKIQQVGSPLELYDHPVNKFVAEFLGTPPMNFIECTLIEENKTFVLDAGVFKVKVPTNLTDITKEYYSQDLILGIRPEDIYISKTKSEETIECEVYLVEPLGSNEIIHVKVNDSVMLISSKLRTAIERGERINITFDFAKVHLFDKKTDKAILARMMRIN